MITKEDFKNKQFNETRKILDTELENGLERELEKYFPSEEVIEIELMSTSHIPVNEDVREHIKDRLLSVHGFEYDDLYMIYKTESAVSNIFVRVYVV